MGTADRRTFLKTAALGAISLGVPACATSRRNETALLRDEVRVRLAAGGDPLAARALAIFRNRVEARSSAKVVAAQRRADVIFAIDPSLAPEAFRIDDVGGAVRVSGGTAQGLLYGVGKLLRTSQYADGAVALSPWRGTSAPRGAFRGMYFASHFSNWYCKASEEEITRYLEDLALWGVNAVMVIFPFINLQGWDDPKSASSLEMMRTYARAAKPLGIRYVTSVNNTMFIGAPESIRADRLPDPTRRRGNSGHPICPSNPEGHAYLMTNARRFYEELADVGIDGVVFWPYDEGGCACAECAPWGSNGYLKLSREFAVLGRTYFPEMKTILSTWMFDTPPEGEWQGLTDALAAGNDWLDYILADAHEDYPRYPLDAGVPGGLPLLNFPEISMWGNSPWGGVGANPLPARYQRLWDQVKHAVVGGLPYSEGIYEDMNKAVVAQFYWDRDVTARETLAEYIDYEFGAGVTDDVLRMVDHFEQAAGASYQKQPVDIDGVRRAYALAESVHARLPEWARRSWRWEILHLRAILDRERFDGGGLETPAAEAAMLRLIEIYHCEIVTDDPYHHRVRPPLKRAVSRQGTK